MSKFNFTPVCTPYCAPTKIDLPHGLSLMVYISQDEDGYESDDELLGDEWSFVRFPCRNFRDDPRIKEVFQQLGISSDGTPDLESLLDNHTEAVLKATNSEPFAEYMSRFSAFQSDEQKIEWLRGSLYSDGAINRFMLNLWNTGLATDQQIVVLDVYSHSGEVWSFTGQGTQCEWDTAHGAGALLPSNSMRKMLNELAETDPRDMQVLAREEAQSYLKGFNLLACGEVYQIVGELVETATGQEVANNVFPDIYSGYLGVEHAQECFDEELCSMKNTATEIAVVRGNEWAKHLTNIAKHVLGNFGISDPGSETLAAKVLAKHLQPPTNFEWISLDV